MLAALLAVFEPCSVMGSLVATTSAMPGARPPGDSLQIGLRTVGGNLPTRIPLLSGSSTLRQRSPSSGMKVSKTHLLLARCSSELFTSFQQSIGPPGTPSNTMISHTPVVVSAGKTKYSPTPGIRLKDTAENGVRGSIFFTYVSASTRFGWSYGDFVASRSNIRLTSLFPAATITRSYVLPYSSMSAEPAFLIARSPPHLA